MKSVTINFRVAPDTKALLERVAAAENRSLTNLVETMVRERARQHAEKEAGNV